MWEQIVNLAIQNGLFAVLFLGLLIFQLKDSSKREKKYQQTIESLNRHLDAVEDIEKNVEDIEKSVEEIKNEVKCPKSRAKNKSDLKGTL
ncbi:MAG: BhlA/UviB family holin-like peptide [Christensenellales bacterium]